LLSVAFVAVSEHVPAFRALATPDVIEQLAEPDVTVKVTVPVPDPPDVDNVIPVSKSPELSRKVKAFCVSLANVTVVATDDCDS
jgi:hypothetical protein